MYVETEKQFVQLVMDFVRLNGFLAYHTWRSDRSAKGFPDVIAVGHDVCLAIELKLDGRYPNAKQAEWLERLGAIEGIWAFCLQPTDWPWFQVLVQRIRLKHPGGMD